MGRKFKVTEEKLESVYSRRYGNLALFLSFEQGWLEFALRIALPTILKKVLTAVNYDKIGPFVRITITWSTSPRRLSSASKLVKEWRHWHKDIVLVGMQASVIYTTCMNA